MAARTRIALAIGLSMLFCWTLAPAGALAHADPYFTVRILCAGLTDGQIDAAMGEVDDNATILVDRPLVGRQQIQAWMEEQLRLNLRIEVVDIQPTQVADGYAVTWTTRMYREDWRKAGIGARSTTEQAFIQNGRITRWTSSLAAELAPGATIQPATAAAPELQPESELEFGGVPLSKVPVTLFILPALVLLVGGGLGLQWLRHRRQARVELGSR
jgi:hypothetical protein